MHLFLSLPTLLPSYPVRFRIEYYLALLRPVAIGDFRSPAIIGGYWNVLAMQWMKARNNHVLIDNWRQGEKVGGNQTGFWGAISFPSLSVKDRSLLVPLVMLNACLTFSWPNKVPFDREASGIIQAGIYTGTRIGAAGGIVRSKWLEGG
jgi:hypothetical protein